MRRYSTSRPTRPRTPGTDWALSGLLLVGIGVCLAGLNPVLGDIWWWVQSMLVAAVVLLAAAVGRSFARHPLWGTLVAALVAIATITAMYASETAILWFVPTADTFAAFRTLEQQGMVAIAEQDIPATASHGILYLLAVGTAAIAVAMDGAAIGFRQPALAGIPMAILLIVPSLVRSYLENAWIFVLAAVVYIAILLVRGERRLGLRGAVGLGATAIIVALFTPITLTPGSTEATGSSNLTAGVNPIITLGDDLRRGEPQHALSYTTTADRGQYLRLAVLESFTGRSWGPTTAEVIPGNEIDQIAPPPGLTDGIAVAAITTTVQVDDLLSRWLPVPYAPSSIRGVDGVWSWDPAGLSIRTDRSNARGQDYEVDSILVQPSVEQLIAAGTVVEPALEHLLAVPDDLPSVVATTALEVVGGAATNYERALALQDYFRGGLFEYSEDAPVEDGYDGSGASVLGRFLEEKSGYCVHFASAMSAMARTLGIPARVAVGFTPGQATPITGTPLYQYDVTTFDFHAWPELYFAEIGWVRFEPTPGRGAVPAFAPLSVDDPATPDVDESVPEPETTVEPQPSSSAAPVLPEDIADGGTVPDANGATPGNTSGWIGLIAGSTVVVVLLLPFVLRSVRRARRLAAVDDGSAAEGWMELRDTTADLGWRTTDTLTPRQFGDDLGELLDSNGARLIASLRAGVERESYGGRDSRLSSDDLIAALRLLRREAGFGRRIAARFAPISLVERWLPAATERIRPAVPAG
jgi:transglutaminase-like putative cysteine protease